MRCSAPSIASYSSAAFGRAIAGRADDTGAAEPDVLVPPDTTPVADSPVYVRNMYQFFRKNAPSIAYESYYNCGDNHRLYPDGRFPKASATYQKLWSGPVQ